MLELNFERYYGGMSLPDINDHNEHQLKKAIDKFNRVTTPKSKVKALLEEIYCYFIRNNIANENFCELNTFIKHWTLAHRGIITDQYLDTIEAQFGILEGPLYIPRGNSHWDTREDHRNDPIPQRGNNE